jgi:hypothetical protein
MSLPLLVVIVVAGIAAIVAAVHFSGGSKPARLAGEAEAIAAFTRDYPDHVPRGAILTASGDAALMPLGEGAFGLVAMFGSHSLTRLVGTGDLATPPVLTETRLILRLRDVTLPRLDLEFADAETADAASRAVASVTGATRIEAS